MKKIVLISLSLVSLLVANDAKSLFENKCATCHKVVVEDKNSLIAPPVNKVMKHVKRSFPNKEEAIAFMKDYVLNPDPKKTICPSIDIFGVMPSMKGSVSKEELEKIVNYMYDNFPTQGMGQGKGTMQGQGGQGKGMGMHGGMGQGGGKGMMQGKGMGMGRGKGFLRIDTNNDGFISKEEFNAFRAKKEGIDVSKIKYDYFFKKIDLNGDGKLSKEEFMEFKKMVKGIH